MKKGNIFEDGTAFEIALFNLCKEHPEVKSFNVQRRKKPIPSIRTIITLYDEEPEHNEYATK